MRIRRGDIWYADLGEDHGSRPAHQGPVLILQDNHFNDSRLATVIVAAISSNPALGRHPGNVTLAQSASGLPKESVVNVSQILTLDKNDLDELVGSIPAMSMDQVAYGLGLVLGMG